MIEIKNLTKTFGDKILFCHFNYVIETNEMLAIVGPSGSGKSTLLNTIGLLDLDYEGEIFYDGKRVGKKEIASYIRNHVNYLFQNYALIEEESVLKNLWLALEYEKLKEKEKMRKIEKALEKVGLKEAIDKKVYTLSGGEQQRVALARVILKRGEIILADEPTGNLDAENGQLVMEILRELQKEGKTVILVTHNEQLAEECDRILDLKQIGL